MKRLLVLLIVSVLISGCGDSTAPDEDSAVPVQSFTIFNNTIYAHKQLIRVDVTPVAGGSATSASFVCNYGERLTPQLAIPAAGAYRIEVFTADQQSMWWDSVALALPGSTEIMVTCGGGSIQFWGECAGLPPSGTTMAP